MKQISYFFAFALLSLLLCNCGVKTTEAETSLTETSNPYKEDNTDYNKSSSSNSRDVKVNANDPKGLEGKALREWLKTTYFVGKHKTLGYKQARRMMYNFIDNKNGKITGVYSGYVKNWRYGGRGTNPMPINCEHTVPQSFFDKQEPMKSDIHHLFPTYAEWNRVRSNFGFDEVDDEKTTQWMRIKESKAVIPTAGIIDEYSEFANEKFEPRESHKGNLARAVFYFYTMYPGKAGDMSRLADLKTLYQWHLKDPVDEAERKRNDAIEKYQGNRNPYIDKPELIKRAWRVK